MKLPPNLNEPIDLSNYVPRKDLPQNKVDDVWTAPVKEWDKAHLNNLLKRIKEFNEQIEKRNNEQQQMYSPSTLSREHMGGTYLEPWWKFW